MHRRAILALAALFSGLALATPAEAGDNTYVTVRALDDRFEQVGQTCGGAAAPEPAIRIGLSETRMRGQGSMSVTSAEDHLGGVLVKQPEPLRGVMYWVWTPTGGSPQGQWRVEVGGEVLTSSAVSVTAGEWARVDLDDATLSDGAGWTGTIEEYVAEFGKGDTWAAGFLTGDCLGSPTVRLDTIGTRKAGYDFEARTWTTLKVTGPDRGPVTLAVRTQKYDDVSATNEPAADARVVLQRRRGSGTPWRDVARVRTDQHGRATWHGTSTRPTDWRAVWQRSPHDVPSDPVRHG